MKVTKRNGILTDVKFDSVTTRILKLTQGLSEHISAGKIAQQVFSSMYDGIHTYEIDILSSEVCIGMIVEHTDYEILATRIAVSNIHKIAPDSFSESVRLMRNIELISDEMWSVVSKNKKFLNTLINRENDSTFGYFGIKTLEKSYLQKVNSRIV